MASDDTLKKAQKAGADWLEAARARAEEFLRELARATDTKQGRAQEAVDDLIEGSKKGTEQLVSSIRSEISAQLGLLGLATKADLADLEKRLTGRAPAAKKAAPVKKAAAKKAAPAGQPAPSAAAKKAAPVKKAAAKKAAN
jgi:polyhydroxyalkanoate synthesis regulator phasin